MAYNASHRFARIAATKVRPFTDLIRGRQAGEAVELNEPTRLWPQHTMRPTRNEGMSVPPNPTAADPVPGSMVRSAVSTTPGDHEPCGVPPPWWPRTTEPRAPQGFPCGRA